MNNGGVLNDPEVRDFVDKTLASLEDTPVPYEECRGPYKKPLDTRDSVSRVETWFDNAVPVEIVERDVYASFILTDERLVTDSGEFSLRADDRDVVAGHGPGVYTITMTATVGGELAPIFVYSVFVGWQGIV